MNLLFTVHYPRLLALVLLLPAYFYLRKQPTSERFGQLLTDKFIIAYILLNFFLMLSANSLTNSLRVIIFYSFTDVFLPYYVTSRSLRNLQSFREALMAFSIAAMILSAVGCFEAARGWLLYDPLERALDVKWSLGGYLDRDDTLRAIASTGQPIALGYVIAVGIGLYLYLQRLVPQKFIWAIGMALLIAGLISPLSRGPWVGAAVMVLLFQMTGPSASSRLAKLGLLGIISLPFLLETSLGEKIVSYLPFIGTIEASTITYRQRLVEIAIGVILQNPFFGASNYLYSPVFQELRTGSGFLDMVNSYIAIGLSSGLVGLFLFCGFFAVTAWKIFFAMRKLTDKHDERHTLGQALFATLLGIMVIIFTVSSISIIPIVYWSIAGAGVAYVRMLAADPLLEPRGKISTSPAKHFRPSTISG